jgi:hypothetical protein
MKALSIKLRISYRAETLTEVITKSYIFWDVILSDLLKVNQRFVGIHLLRLQDRRVS